MKTTTLTKRFNYSDFEPELKKVLPSVCLETLSDGFEVDYMLEKVGVDLGDRDLIKLARRFTCIGYNEDETFTMINRAYLAEEFEKYLGTATEGKEQALDEFVKYSCVSKIQRDLNQNENDEKSELILQFNTELGELIDDIANVGEMELYYDYVADFLDTIIPREGRVLTLSTLDFLLDDVVCRVFEPTLYLEEKQERRIAILLDDVTLYVQNISIKLNIDRFSNADNIIEYIVDDVMGCTTLEEYTSEDIATAFRRYVESEC